jgi:DNA (cytosine-5)-methyltransferase 1
MRYLSVCSGIEAATVAWHHMGWTPVAFSDIEPFPSAVLAHHYPHVPNLGDMTKFEEWNLEPIDLLVGGTPCQSFSVAGLRKGLADPRGNLMLTYGAIAKRYRPKWLVWENVPGVLSSNEGRDFATFLGMLAELGYGFAYRILDAQYFGVAQRRRRVFVVGYAGDWRRAAAVVFERKSLSRDTPQIIAEKTRIGRVFPCLTRRGLGCLREEEGLVAEEVGIRHLTPIECERLQGFPDNYTNISWRKKKESPNGLRVSALGNSMAVPVMRWIGERINKLEVSHPSNALP